VRAGNLASAGPRLRDHDVSALAGEAGRECAALKTPEIRTHGGRGRGAIRNITIVISVACMPTPNISDEDPRGALFGVFAFGA